MACCNTYNSCSTCGNNNAGIFGNDLWIWIVIIALVVILFTVG